MRLLLCLVVALCSPCVAAAQDPQPAPSVDFAAPLYAPDHPLAGHAAALDGRGCRIVLGPSLRSNFLPELLRSLPPR